jgi:hypothetical protein
MFDQTPNALASLALLLWPVVAFALVRGLGPARGVVATILGGYLLLPPGPAGFDVPLMPPLNKDTIPTLAALAAVLLLAEPRPRLLPQAAGARALLVVFFLSPWVTVLANPDPVVWGSFVLPPLQVREVVGITVMQAVIILPLLLGRALLAGEADARDLLWALLLGGLFYSLPMLLEVRLAPQLNIWIYGFFQHSFDQMMRGDGFRPIVFLYHGLWAALFATTALAAGAALLRIEAGGGRGMALAGATLWMLMVLVLCKSLAPLLYALLLLPLLLLAPVRLQLALAAAMAVVPLAYPAAKTAGLVPQDALVALAERSAPERARSLEFRLSNEDVLLARANERPLFGWGLWNRSQILQNDTGRQLTIPDGRWIIVLGVFGWVGLLASFGLLMLPALLAWQHGRGARAPDGGPSQPPPRAMAALALILAVNLVDLLPNATETPLTWLVAGALLGWAERQRQPSSHAAAEAARPAAPWPAFGGGPVLAPAPAAPVPTLAFTPFQPALRPAPARRPAFETVL